MGEIVLYKIQVTGYVQGVGFRYCTVREARRLGIKGYVRNMPDGSVYIEAEGDREQLEALVRWCNEGPGYVESVKVSTYPPVGYKDFSIKY
ncbi:MAG TPA: acylphosphatase [Bacteroidales bacterium]|nr:acylphosphatase [Bacteroidales bacterium]HOK74049.1 acylphosphatase [Bacteroidales bacterium]HOM40841.1 acylphosphatase [Bacteroidales bacterium]HOU31613.1 acylphosphatase [Bacteroidales bacterium]HPP92493.1 acylphosphatase [Bacteroidales bacterium]